MKKAKKKKRKVTSMGSLIRPNANELLKNAKNYSVYECLTDDSYKISGECTVIFSRKLSESRLLVGVYLVDLYCLWIKNTFYLMNTTYSKYKNELILSMAKTMNLVACPVDLAHSIIYGSVEYAENLGFSPHPDFEKSRKILEPKKSFKKLPKVKFGNKGKPRFISGPDDDVRSILETLDRNVGKGNYEFITGQAEIDDLF